MIQRVVAIKLKDAYANARDRAAARVHEEASLEGPVEVGHELADSEFGVAGANKKALRGDALRGHAHLLPLDVERQAVQLGP